RPFYSHVPSLQFGAAVASGLTAEKGKQKHVPTATDESDHVKLKHILSSQTAGSRALTSLIWLNSNPRNPAATLEYVDCKSVNRRPLKPATTDYYRIRQQSRRPFKDSVKPRCSSRWELLIGVFDHLSRNQLMQHQCEEECLGLARLLPPMETALLDWLMNLMAD
nr:Rho GTPase-activating protein 5-like [Tanacetum cinerariifolium]